MKFPPQLSLEPLRSEMTDAAVELDQQTLGGLWTAQAYQAEIKRDNSICLGILTPSSELVGMSVAWTVVDEAHITLIAVEPQWQSQGLGSLLLCRMLTLAIGQQDCARATLEVNSANDSAIYLYQKFQFCSLGIRANYYRDGGDALIMWRNHLQSSEYQDFLASSFAERQMKLAQNGIQLSATGC